MLLIKGLWHVSNESKLRRCVTKRVVGSDSAAVDAPVPVDRKPPLFDDAVPQNLLRCRHGGVIGETLRQRCEVACIFARLSHACMAGDDINN